MKKALSLICILALIIGLTSCNSYKRRPQAEMDKEDSTQESTSLQENADGQKHWLSPLFEAVETLTGTAISFTEYKGAPVIILPKDTLSGTMSFGAIICEELDLESPTVMNHEWGHIIQLFTLGLKKYALTVALPSVVSFSDKQMDGMGNNDYYSLPSERLADKFGGVDRGEYTNKSDAKAWVYYISAILCTW